MTSLVSNTTAVLRTEGVILDASATSITNSVPSDLQRLSYSWECPTFISTFCSTQEQSTLQISYGTFMNNSGAFNIVYPFKVNVSYILING